MAFYNPQRVVFDPDTMTIKNAGAVGDFLYNASRDYLKRQDELAQQKAQQEQWDRQHQLENDKFAYQQNQDAFNNNLKLDEFNFNQTKWGQEHALKQRAQDTDEWYKRQNVAQGWGNLNVARQNANTSARNADLNEQELAYKLQQLEQEKAQEQAGEQMQIKNMPNFFASNPDAMTIMQINDELLKRGYKDYYDGQGLLGGTTQNIKGLFGGYNANDERDRMAALMSDFIYRTSVRRDTSYNLERHRQKYPEISSLNPQTINKKNFENLVRGFNEAVRASINDEYNNMAKSASVLKNPTLAGAVEKGRTQNIKNVEDRLLSKLVYSYGANQNTPPSLKGEIGADGSIVLNEPQNATQAPSEANAPQNAGIQARTKTIDGKTYTYLLDSNGNVVGIVE